MVIVNLKVKVNHHINNYQRKVDLLMVTYPTPTVSTMKTFTYQNALIYTGIETTPLNYSANQWTGFYMIGISVMKEVKVLQYLKNKIK